MQVSAQSAAVSRRVKSEQGSQIAEFAIALPLLVVFVVGIFDFSGAVTLKQKLTNAANEGARIAASDPADDLASPPASGIPASVQDAYSVVDSYLLAEQINDCGLSTAKPVQSATTLTWVSTASGCPGGAGGTLQLTINRGCIAQESGGAVDAVNTCVTILYPYSWQFTGVAGLFGGSFTPSGISTTATAFDEN